MSRGKHSASTAKRVREESSLTIEGLRRELRACVVELGRLRCEAARVPGLEQRCHDLQRAIANGEQPEVARLRVEIEGLHERTREAEARTEKIQGTWDKLVLRLIEQHGGGVAGYETVLHLVGGDEVHPDAIVFDPTPTSARLDIEAKRRLARAKRR